MVYSKVYGRMGLVFFSFNKYVEVVVYYKKVLELDFDNEIYKFNFKIVELKLWEVFSFMGGVGSFDIVGLLNNFGFMSMVLNLMNNF